MSARRSGKPELTGAVIKQLFAVAGNGHRLHVPDDDICEEIAARIAANAARGDVIMSEPTLTVAAKKHLRLALRHLDAAREKIDDRYRAYDWMADQRNPHFDERVEFYAAARGMQGLLERYRDESICTTTWHDLANVIAGYASDAWKQAGGSANDKRAGSPLCVFVRRALLAVGITQAEDTVADALRKRTGPASRDSKRSAVKNRSK